MPKIIRVVFENERRGLLPLSFLSLVTNGCLLGERGLFMPQLQDCRILQPRMSCIQNVGGRKTRSDKMLFTSTDTAHGYLMSFYCVLSPKKNNSGGRRVSVALSFANNSKISMIALSFSVCHKLCDGQQEADREENGLMSLLQKDSKDCLQS